MHEKFQVVFRNGKKTVEIWGRGAPIDDTELTKQDVKDLIQELTTILPEFEEEYYG